MDSKKIVGIVDLNSPSIYVDKNQFIWILQHTKNNQEDQNVYISNEYADYDYFEERSNYDDYGFYINQIILKEGRFPTGDYETIIPISQKEQYKLGKEYNKKVNDHKLIVVGYYESKRTINSILVSTQTLKYYVISKSSNIAIKPVNKEEAIKKIQDEYQMTVKDSYKVSREIYIEQNKNYVKSILITSAIILAISLIEIVLMMRSSFLSHVKEVGIYRAIGVKKFDIYIMFSGEIIAITTMACIPGLVLSAYILSILSKVEFLTDYLEVNIITVIYSIIVLYGFNLLIGLIPVFNTMKKRPAEILSRTDI